MNILHLISAPPTYHPLQQFPELKFKYVEEDHPEEFFIPYVWMLIHTRSGLYWPSRNIRLRHNSTDSDTNTSVSEYWQGGGRDVEKLVGCTLDKGGKFSWILLQPAKINLLYAKCVDA